MSSKVDKPADTTTKETDNSIFARLKVFKNAMTITTVACSALVSMAMLTNSSHFAGLTTTLANLTCTALGSPFVLAAIALLVFLVIVVKQGCYIKKLCKDNKVLEEKKLSLQKKITQLEKDSKSLSTKLNTELKRYKTGAIASIAVIITGLMYQGIKIILQ